MCPGKDWTLVTSISMASPQRVDGKNGFAVDSERPVRHEFFFVQIYPNLHLTDFFQGQFAARNGKHGFHALVFNMDVWQMMLPSVHKQHPNDDAIEHANSWHSWFLQG